MRCPPAASPALLISESSLSGLRDALCTTGSFSVWRVCYTGKVGEAGVTAGATHKHPNATDDSACVQVEREASIVYKPHRLPAWCDRVLWHSNMPHSMHPLCSGYFMVAEADSSDHKPVAAVFTLPAVLSPAQVVSDSIESAPPRSRVLEAELDNAHQLAPLYGRATERLSVHHTQRHLCPGSA